MSSMNAILLLDYLAVRRRQQETHIQILKNEATSAERSYNLLFSYISHNQRLFPRDSIDEMTGILSSISNLRTTIRPETRRSTPSLATQLRSTMNRSTSTPNSWRTREHTNRTRSNNTWTFPTGSRRPQTINFTRTTFDDTPIPPTQAEIEISTLSCKYLDVSTNQIICPIARTNFENNDDILKIIHCNHIFKKESLLTWFQTKQTCPICRHNITQFTPPPRPPTSLPPIGTPFPPV